MANCNLVQTLSSNLNVIPFFILVQFEEEHDFKNDSNLDQGELFEAAALLFQSESITLIYSSGHCFLHWPATNQRREPERQLAPITFDFLLLIHFRRNMTLLLCNKVVTFYPSFEIDNNLSSEFSAH